MPPLDRWRNSRYYLRTMADTHHDADRGPGLLSNAIAIIAFIVVIAIVIWGLLHLANLSTSWFTSFLPHRAPVVTVTAPASAHSGTPFDISWKYSGSDTGMYAFVYKCVSGVALNDANGAHILCGTAHPLLNASSSTMTVTPIVSGATTTLPVSIVFIPAATSSSQVTGTASVALAPAAPAPDTQNPGTPITTGHAGSADSSGPQTTPVSHSPADLSVRIISVTTGSLDSVQFDIANVGGSTSGSYTFTAYLPTSDSYVYSSPVQAPLSAGSHVANTLQFTGSTGGTVTIVIKPTTSDNSANNTASQSVGGSYSPYGQYQSGYDYPPQYDYSQYYPQSSYQPQYPYTGYTYPSYTSQPQYPTLPDETGYGAQYQYLY